MVREFTREQLEQKISMKVWECDLAAFTLALLDRSEADQRELIERGKDIHTLTCALESERLRAEKAEARKTAKEILDTGGEWRELTDREVELLMLATIPDLLSEDQQAGRDRLSRLVCTAHSLLTSRRSAEAERDRLREDLSKCGEEKSIQESIHDLLTERDRLREELETERMRLAACGVLADCNTPKSAAKYRSEIADKYRSGSLDSVCRVVDEEMRLMKENNKLRSIAANLFAKHGGECHYCGVDSIEKCPHGFPGCSIADDINCGEENS